MNKIQVKVINPDILIDAEKMMVAMARLTQRGHKLSSMEDFMKLYNMQYSDELVEKMSSLPHGTIQRFGTINVVIIGASRRFLAQITRHQAGVTFMSGSLQYSDYSGAAQFTIPYEIIKLDMEEPYELANGDKSHDWRQKCYLASCMASLSNYEAAIKQGVPNDAAGYMMPQGMRNILVISANPLAFSHMISQRICRRNTPETRYVMLKIWQELRTYSNLFDKCGAPCMQYPFSCPEGSFSCGEPILLNMPGSIIDDDFKYIKEET